MNATKASGTIARTEKSGDDSLSLSLPSGMGYDTDIKLFANRYKQGGRTVFSLDLSLTQIASIITPPDPSVAAPGNRAIRPAHADAFGKYLRLREDWVSPGMILRAPDVFKFDMQAEVGGVQFGILSFPRLNMTDINILDGQHRILGIFRAQASIADDLDKARSQKARARKVDPGGRAEADAQAEIDKLEKQRKRLDQERVSVQIHVVDDPTEYKQMFFDIADNALGITASVKTRFDSTKVVNRALEMTQQHPLLLGRVDPEGDRAGRGSPYLLGAKHVGEVIRSVNVGLEGRVSKRQEVEFKEKDLAKRTHEYFDTIVEAFPPLRAITLGQLTTEQLRKTSLLGSVLMLRALAGTYYELISLHHWKRDDVEEYFSKLSPHMAGPVYEGSIWLEQLPGVFQSGGFAPSGRRQDLKALKDALVNWALDHSPVVESDPAPRPVVVTEESEEEDYGTGYTAFGADIPDTK